MSRSPDRPRRAPGGPRPAWRPDEARFRTLIEAASDGVLVVRGDGAIGFANPAACALLGRGADELVGRPFGVPVVPGETTEIDVLRDDGEVRVAEMRAAATSWQGEPAHLATLRDVTERRRAEDAAREALATLRSFYDGAPMMMGVVELSGDEIIHVSSNAATARFLGGRPEEADHHPDGRLGIPRATLDLWLDRCREAERAGGPVRFEFACEAADGPRWLAATVGFIARTSLGRPQFSFVVEDVTDRRRAEQAMREADRRKDEFLAMLAHELRNPLAAISNAVQLSRRDGSEAHWPWCREIVARQSKNLSRLVDDLLDVSRITRGKVRLRTERIDAAPVVAAAVEAVRPLMEQRRHELTVSVAAGPLPLEADPTRLEQIVVNLLTNAAKYTEEGGRIALSAAIEGAEVVVRVKDNGAGIAPEALPRMFEMFVQGDRSLARSEGGLGIGLTLVRSLAEMHGGSVSAASDGPGTGSEFVVRLPMAPGARGGDPPPAPTAGDGAVRAARILVVDDNADTARGLSELLGLLGHEASVVHDGPSAIEAARSRRPEVVLLDIGLPGMDGYQVAERLRREAPGPAPVIIAISGYGREDARHRSLEPAFDHHLIKPIDFDALADLIDRVRRTSGMGDGLCRPT
jgi:signal transduction histidine kinase/ActR/RegA family two-component response regulator